MNPYVSSLSLYDIAGTPGVAADISHINTKAIAKVQNPPQPRWESILDFALSAALNLLSWESITLSVGADETLT